MWGAAPRHRCVVVLLGVCAVLLLGCVRSATGAVAPINWAANPSVDFDGDHRTDLGALYRGRSPLDSLWYAPSSSGAGPFQIYFGATTDVPVAGDYDGDGKTDVAIYRPNVQGSTALWHAQLSGGGTYDAYWGNQSDIPVPADYNGDRRADPVTFRPSNGLWSGPFNGTTGALQYTLGQSGDVPVPGYYDNKDSAADPAIYRPSSGLWF